MMKSNIIMGKNCVIQENVVLGNDDSLLLIIGDNALIRSGSIIYSKVKIGNNFKTGHRVFVRENTYIGDNVLLGTESVIDGNCRLGNNISIQTNAYITAFTTIEDDVFIGPRVVTANDKYMMAGAKLIGPTIKKGARIGANSTILPGVMIGEGAVVGSGSVVTKDVPAGVTVVGNPARPLIKKQDTGTVRKGTGRIAVIGMGYVGIPIAALLADAGYTVTGIQRRSEKSGWKIDWINSGKCPIGGKEPELPDIIQRVVSRKNFHVTDDYSVIKDVDIILIDVQTAIGPAHEPLYEPLKDACHALGKYLSTGKTVIVESTVGPGTTQNIVRPILEKESGLKAGLPDGFGLCFSYERVMVGRLVHNIREYPKIVGGFDNICTAIATGMYRSIVRNQVYGTDIITAEISKTVENAYRDVQIAFANEVALICETFNTDVYNVRKFVNGLPDDPSTPRANPLRNMHFPGAGVGGHCLPKDGWLLMHSYNEYAGTDANHKVSIISDARYLNDWMPVHMVDLFESALKETGKNIKGSHICILGYAFLENSDDTRNTPTIPLVAELVKRGASYTIHDPFVTQGSEYHIESDLNTAIKGCDGIILMTAHEIYRSLDPSQLKSLLNIPIIIDGRNVFDQQDLVKSGFIFRGVGKNNSITGSRAEVSG